MQQQKIHLASGKTRLTAASPNLLWCVVSIPNYQDSDLDKLIFQFLVLLSLISLTLQPLSGQSMEVEGSFQVSSNTPIIRLFDSASGEQRIEGEIRENFDDIWLRAYYGSLRFGTGTVGSIPNDLVISPEGNVGINSMTINSNGRIGIEDVAPNHQLSLGSTTATTKIALHESDLDPSVNYGLGVTSGTFRFNLNSANAKYGFYDAPGSSANEVFEILGNGRLFAHTLQNIGDQKNMQYNSTTGEIGYDNSSRRYKRNIKTLEDDWEKILQTRPVQYTRPASPEHWEYGYIAEEIDSIGLTNLVGYDIEGMPDDVKYDRMVIYLTEILKMHQKELAMLRQEILMLKGRRFAKSVPPYCYDLVLKY